MGKTPFYGGISDVGKKTESPYSVFEMISHDATDENIGAHLEFVIERVHITTVAPKTNTNTTAYNKEQLTFSATDRDSDGFAYFEALEDGKNYDAGKWETKIFVMPLTTNGATPAPNVPSTPAASTGK
ncbi:hypothetical protein [Companilactobacillus bobalius]|uniref:hypothetical protein n=1 Tax=Companilactobacillus bobalius TaxID=2801451 RepID=UPI001302E923|nr:hypothetical protein [Companilactobacillus bobalius]KAE9560655.1 hypothetical protein ATN92_10995 [Companilactobacillus bobalius]